MCCVGSVQIQIEIEKCWCTADMDSKCLICQRDCIKTCLICQAVDIIMAFISNTKEIVSSSFLLNNFDLRWQEEERQERERLRQEWVEMQDKIKSKAEI